LTSPSSHSSSKRRSPRRGARRPAGFLIILAALAATARVVHATPGQGPLSGSTAISAAGYVERLDAVRQLAEAHAARPSPERMEEVRRRLGLPLDVEVGAGVVHVPRDDFLASRKGSGADDFRQAADHIAAMEDAAKAALAAPAGSRDGMAAALRDAYRGISTRPGLLQRLRHDAWVVVLGLWDRLRSLLRRVPLPPGLLVLAAALLLALAAAVVVRRLRYVVPERAGRGQGGRRHPGPDWHRIAEEALARGDLAAALRARYRALLAALEARGVIPDAPSLTAGECRKAVAGGLPGAYPAVARATSIFEQAVYGRAPLTLGEVDALRDAEQSVRA